jgi:murein L,D-transpeptidase YafK
VRKRSEGDQRTPVGVYFVTSRLSASQLKDFYGIGALPLNYPNEYDRRLGKTGGGIWLHGVPPDSYARSPQSTDGCVVLSNQDLAALLSQITPRATPVVIAEHLDWRAPSALQPDRAQVLDLLKSWQQAREAGDLQRLLSFYSPQFSNGSQDFSQWAAALSKEVGREAHTIDEVKDLSVLRWRDRSDILVLTFAELRAGNRTGHIKRQYWGKENGSWKIFYEGVLG